jgi:hypothetical protein
MLKILLNVIINGVFVVPYVHALSLSLSLSLTHPAGPGTCHMNSSKPSGFSVQQPNRVLTAVHRRRYHVALDLICAYVARSSSPTSRKRLNAKSNDFLHSADELLGLCIVFFVAPCLRPFTNTSWQLRKRNGFTTVLKLQVANNLFAVAKV